MRNWVLAWLLTSLTLLTCPAQRSVASPPTVFRVSEQVVGGDVVLLSGGNLAGTNAIDVWRLPEGNPGLPPAALAAPAPGNAVKVTPIQPSEGSVKFVLPEKFAPGVFAVQFAMGEVRGPIVLLNRPELWFAQPVILQPGLAASQALAGAEIQIVGKNLTLRGEGSPRPKVAIRRKQDGDAVLVPVTKAEPYSLLAKLPSTLTPGQYELFAHPGRGGSSAWSEPMAFEIKMPTFWPEKRLNVRDFGAKGDDVTDDTQAIRKALAAAEANGGGVVFFPWGTYRLSDWLLVPPRTVLRGEIRDATVLKWPLDPPKDDADFARAAIYIGRECGLEELTLVARRVETIVFDVQYEFYSGKSVPAEVTHRIRPWGQGGDIFLRRLLVHHLLLAGRPEEQKPVTESPKLNRKYWQGLRNVLIHDGRNVEISDCVFEGGDQIFGNLVNGRVVRNSFANHMGYSWTNLGGGAVDVVCEANEIKGSSSWGWGWVGMQRVYSAHNNSHNFVRGEREAMTLDISAMPTSRPTMQYWGTPIEQGTDNGRPFLRFPPADRESLDGFRTGWLPGCFRGGSVTIRAFQGGNGAGQSRSIVENTADTIYLDKPFSTALETTPRRMFLEVTARHPRAHFGTTTWLGSLSKSEPAGFTAKNARWVPGEFLGMAALVLDGPGAGQYRVVTRNTENEVTFDRPWDVIPDESSVVGIWSLPRHMVVYDCTGTDTSAFGQLYGSFYDYTVDGCRSDRTQGLWGQMGWFVQFLDNRVSYAQSYHPGIGMRGPNPEKNAPFGYTGLDSHRLRVTKTAAFQYPDRMLPLFADEVLGRPVPTTLGHTQRNNVLRSNQRIVVQPWTGDSPPAPRAGGNLFRDIILDGNTIEHSAVGIQLGPNVGQAVLARNIFRDVARPVWLANPKGTVDLGPGGEGESLFASGDLTGWVEEQHSFFKAKHPNVSTWSVKDGVVTCDGSRGNCGFLRYDRKLADFVLRFEYRMPTGCNSGVCVRVPAAYNGLPDETLPSKTGYEVQIQDDAGTGRSLYTSGALYGAVAPEASAARPAGEWNEMEIICRGPRLRVTLNGKTVQDVDQTEIGAIRERKRSGYLMLQNHGHAIEFRNLRLKVESAGR